MVPEQGAGLSITVPDLIKWIRDVLGERPAPDRKDRIVVGPDAPNEPAATAEEIAAFQVQLNLLAELLEIQHNLDLATLRDALADGCRFLEQQLMEQSASLRTLRENYRQLQARQQEMELESHFLEQKIERIEGVVAANLAAYRDKEEKLEKILADYERREADLTRNIFSIKSLIDDKSRLLPKLTRTEKDALRNLVTDLNAFLQGKETERPVAEIVEKMKTMLLADHQRQVAGKESGQAAATDEKATGTDNPTVRKEATDAVALNDTLAENMTGDGGGSPEGDAIRHLGEDIQYLSQLIDRCRQEKKIIRDEPDILHHIHEILDRHHLRLEKTNAYSSHDLKLIVTPLTNLRRERFMGL
ncbi:MAG: hypothetical protein JXQ27_13020 [Acidobacteria bacterium]|nr:hypothetical protein [Acidobacteriota bacterium]